MVERLGVRHDMRHEQNDAVSQAGSTDRSRSECCTRTALGRCNDEHREGAHCCPSVRSVSGWRRWLMRDHMLKIPVRA